MARWKWGTHEVCGSQDIRTHRDSGFRRVGSPPEPRSVRFSLMRSRRQILGLLRHSMDGTSIGRMATGGAKTMGGRRLVCACEAKVCVVVRSAGESFLDQQMRPKRAAEAGLARHGSQGRGFSVLSFMVSPGCGLKSFLPGIARSARQGLVPRSQRLCTFVVRRGDWSAGQGGPRHGRAG